jgi:NAD+ kinase
MKIRRALLILKRTAIEELESQKRKTASEKRLHRLLQEGHRSIDVLESAHEEHLASVRIVRRELRARGVPYLERNSAPAVIRGVDLVITVGGDGTLLRASHAVRGQTAVLGVNSAPATSVGFLTGCRAPTFAQTLDALLAGRLEPLQVARLRLRIGSREIPEPVLNDVLFCHDNPAMTTRYRLLGPEGEELQRSSGVWISAPAGTTAALRSAGGTVLPLTARAFAYVVREPYAPPGSVVRFPGGRLAAGQKLALEVRSSPTSVFLDGSHRRYKVAYGELVSFALHRLSLRLVRPRDGFAT